MPDWALYYAGMGLRIIPVWWPIKYKMADGSEVIGCACRQEVDCDNIGKHPCYKKDTLEHGIKDATTDASVISNWWKMWPEANIAVCCGKQPDGSGLVCIDLDAHAEGQNGTESLARWQAEQGCHFPATLTVKTGSGNGLHMYFRTDGRSIKQRADWLGDNCGIDVRYSNYYAILPPSLHKSGNRYAWVTPPEETELADANEAVYQFLEIKGKPGPKKPPGDGRGAKTRYIGQDIPDGTRNDTLFRYGCGCRGRGMEVGEILTELLELNEKKCKPPKKWDKIVDLAKHICEAYEAGSAEAREQGEGGLSLDVNPKTEKPLQTITNAVRVMEYDGQLMGCLAYNTLAKRLTVVRPLPWDPPQQDRKRTWTDIDDCHLRLYLEKYGLVARTLASDAAMVTADNHSYNPLTAMLDECEREYDGKEHIARLLPFLVGAPESEYQANVMKTFMVGCVARAYHPGTKMDVVPVLRGPQGNGKSSFIRALALAPEFYLSNVPTFEGRDALSKLRGKWIAELSELLANKRAKDQEGIKAFLTADTDTFREAYGRYDVDYPRVCSFIGTTNETEFLADTTGSRRWWPIETTQNWRLSIRSPAAGSLIRQAWGEAIAIYKTITPMPEEIKPSAELAAVRSQLSEVYEAEDPWTPLIAGWIEDHPEVDKLCAGMLLELAIKMRPEQRKNNDAIRVNKILRDRIGGWERQKKTTRVYWDSEGEKRCDVSRAFVRSADNPRRH